MGKKKRKRPTPPPAPSRAGVAKPAGPSRKQQELAARRKAERRDALRRWATRAAAVALVALVVVGVWLFNRQQNAQLREALTSGSCEVDTRSDPTRAAGQNHVPNPSYAVNPPAGGDHAPSAARSGVYEGSSVPADGALVHSLEHGYVVVWHQPELPPEQVDELEEFERRHDGDVVVAERSGLPVPVAATAWGQRLLCQEVEPKTLDRFFAERVGDGPEDVERG